MEKGSQKCVKKDGREENVRQEEMQEERRKASKTKTGGDFGVEEGNEELGKRKCKIRKMLSAEHLTVSKYFIILMKIGQKQNGKAG